MIFPVWVILMLFQLLLAWQLVLHFYLTLRSTKNIKKCPSNATFHFITPKFKKRNRKNKNLLKVKNVKLKDKSKMLVDFELMGKVGVNPFFNLQSSRIINGTSIYFFNIKFSALFNTIYK